MLNRYSGVQSTLKRGGYVRTSSGTTATCIFSLENLTIVSHAPRGWDGGTDGEREKPLLFFRLTPYSRSLRELTWINLLTATDVLSSAVYL